MIPADTDTPNAGSSSAPTFGRASEGPFGWTPVQQQRLRELGVAAAALAAEPASFAGPEERDAAFRELEKRLSQEQRQGLRALQGGLGTPAPRVLRLEAELAGALRGAGFTQVRTPTLLSKCLLVRMGIREGHPMYERVFWVDEKHCLRPMLAPHLYSLLVDLSRVWDRPIRLFEVGSCFRRETRGAQHAAEFTMLNLVELGLPAELCRGRLEELARVVLQAAGISDLRIEEKRSVVYGTTIDIVNGGLELGSAAVGPHPLDRPWRITEPWVGIGFGLERLLMVREGSDSLGRWSRSLEYLDGYTLRL
jgi:pyrrolysyl-tRNA synthetase-like protein